ncbi:uncharacterized protein LOC115631593 [Scaptodrosophila lebanonensis]|uniref:Uncharacterized protein LOC115631593 n=1 Tax=Drosophila lebanonensis TaxID=7225 RepID=A0A6J2U7F5_DROLE|nr:uncharacterized protein LOC115631593 [Scaptodrosophila lebanonensis]
MAAEENKQETEAKLPLAKMSSVKSKLKINYCCITKEYYSEYTNLVDSLHISPRVITHKQVFRKNCTFALNLNIRNSGLYPRLIKLSTDSPEDTTINVPNLEINRFLGTDQTLEVKIAIHSKSSKEINRRRHILIECFHPNIIFQVPIIVLKNLEEPSICENFVFPACVPVAPNKSYFEMIIFNPTKDPVKLIFRNTFRGLTMNTQSNTILPAYDFMKVLLTLEPRKLHVYKGFFNVKFGLSPPKSVVFEFTPKSMGVNVSAGYIRFGQQKFMQREDRTVTICNESSHLINLAWTFQTDATVKFNTAAEELPKKPSEDAVSMHSILLFEFDEDAVSHNAISEMAAAKHFIVEAPTTIGAGSAYEVVIGFQPLEDPEVPFSDETDPPYFQRSKVSFCFTDAEECIETHYITIAGEILGIEVEVFPKIIDFRKIYLGEEHCAQIKILNSDAMHATVRFKDYQDVAQGGVHITPTDGFTLEPCTRGIFHLSFYSVTPTRFSITLRFKVNNGPHYKVFIRGIGQYVQLRTFPQLVEFGSIPIAVPQKRYMLLMNPLAVPITLQVHATEDGEEQPLVLNIRDSTEMLPITIRDPIKHLQMVHEDLRKQDVDPLNDIELVDDLPEINSLQSFQHNESVYSLEFEEDVMEPVPALAGQLLSNLKKQKIFEKSETDKRVIQEALQGLLNAKYFSQFTKHNNFIFMDWNSIPSDPQEVYCDNEIIYLRPNTGRSITILIIPNKVGYFHRSLTVRICPAVSKSDDNSSEELSKMFIKSEFLCSKLWFEYNCCTPDIEWVNSVDLRNQIIYAGEDYDFDMTFTNTSHVGGFLHFDVVPAEMSFRDGTWKFYLPTDSQTTAKCSVTFRSLGATKLSGLISMVGSSRPFTFHLFANVLPTEIRITPTFVHQRLQVLEVHKVHFYIDNHTPTNTKLSMRLKDSTDQYITLSGNILAATGQSMYTTLVSVFSDPDLYQNILYIDLQFDHVMEIPITFLVEGVPLYFEPNIREGFDAGLLITDPVELFQENVYRYRFPVKVINKGRRSYRLVITRLKTYSASNRTTACATQSLTARFDMVPKHLLMPPEGIDYLEILVSGMEPGVFYGDFRLEVTDLKYPNRKHVIRVTTKATFVDCQLSWSRRQVVFNYQRCNPLKERSYIETPELINAHNVLIDEVHLQASGPFRIKELFEHDYEKHIKIRLNPLERKEIFIVLNRAHLKQFYCKQIEGHVNVIAAGKLQKSLKVKINILMPEMRILQPEVVLFAQLRSFDTFVDIMNLGCLPGDFKWQRLDVSEQYIGDLDDPADCVAELLSEILRMLEYNFSCDDEPNMTLRYQQCRCQFHQETETSNLVLDIIDEIINDLDLAHRRLLIHMEDVTPTLDNSELHSSTSFVERTIYDILDKLNLESSQQLSPPSSEYCFAERSIFFYEKCGVLEADQSLQCLLHLPYIRRAHEIKAIFQLNVVGGISQCLSVTLVNLTRQIRFHKDNIYLNVRPWYETFNTTIRLTNVTRYPLHLLIAELNRGPAEKRLIDGFAKLVDGDTLYMEPMGNGKINVLGILGFSENFNRNFGVIINTTASTFFRLRGQGVLPILSMNTDLPRMEQDQQEIMEEYRLLRNIYNYEIFKSITEFDEEPKVSIGEEEDGLDEDKISSDFSEISLSDDEMSSERQHWHDLHFFKMVQSYVMVINNQELPNAVVLKQMLETERYLQRLRRQPELYAIHKKVYLEYEKAFKVVSYKLPTSVKHFTVQPIPCQQHGYILNLGKLRLNSLRRFEFRLHFFGPGKLIAAARTAVKIPGLYVDFLVDNHDDLKFTYWAEKCYAPEFFNKKYRNMLERLMDAEKDPRLQHAHSFDIDDFKKHQRDITDTDRRLIDEYYNSLNLSVYPDHKHHFMLAKIYTSHHSNFSGIDLRVVGLYKPESKYYEVGQLLEDFIYIDLHLGPTLPILLRGVMANE